MCSSRHLTGIVVLAMWFLAGPSPAEAQFSDNFNRGSIGPDWTVVDGTWDISSNQLRLTGATSTARFIKYTANTSDSAVQYCGIQIQGTTSHYYRLRFREDSSSGNHYQLELAANDNQIHWYVRGSTNSTIRTISTSGWAAGQEFALTVTGTGSNTVVYVWRNPPATIPTSASTWDGNSSPLHTMTVGTPPTSYADDGLGFGLGGRHSATGTILFDDWRGGAVGAGGGGGTLRRLMTMGIGLLLWYRWW